mgnify:CR=1 FL=1
MQALQFEHSFAKSDAVTCPWQPGRLIGSPVIAIPLPPKFKGSYWKEYILEIVVFWLQILATAFLNQTYKFKARLNKLDTV